MSSSSTGPTPRFLQEALRLWDEGTAWSGLPDDALAFVLARSVRADRVLLVVDGPDRAERVARALRFFHPEPAAVCTYPADDARPYDGFSPDARLPAERNRTARRVEGAATDAGLIVVAPVQALLQVVPDRATRNAGTRVLRAGQEVDRDALSAWLADAGYLATGRVDAPGTFAVRGDIVDVWPAGARHPVRLDLFDDELEEVRRFDPASQRTVRPLERAIVLPAREERLDRDAVGRLYAELARHVGEQQRGNQLRRRVIEELRAGIRFSSIEAWLPALVPTVAPLDVLGDLRIVVLEPEEVGAAARDLERTARQRWAALDDDERPLVPPEERYVPAADVIERLASAQRVMSLALEGRAVDLGARTTDGFAVKGADLAPTVARLRELTGLGVRVVLVTDSDQRAERLIEMLEAHELAPRWVRAIDDVRPGELALVVGDLPRGFVAPASGWAFVPVSALFGERSAASKGRAAPLDAGVSHLAQLKDGDHVVHRVHGVGLFRGIQRVAVQGELVGGGADVKREAATQDFVKVEYRGGDLLYLPATRLEQITRYHPAHSGAKIRLDRLGGQTWAARRGKVRDSILKMAQALLATAAKRELARRDPIGDAGPMYRAFEARFPYVETPDQAAAIDAVCADLEGSAPMDHLLVGDVGFGKTEVAMRAAMRVVESGRQVAVLCPTTVLAMQQHERFVERFAGFPVRVEMLSRFVAKADERTVLADMRDGKVDIVIGTTKLLGRGTRYANLGLVVIDEEHRYGVQQKARLKRLRESLDVLSMSATPIPRTLEMGLTGMRTMSIMATPPRDRLAVRTSIARMSEARVRDAILGELERGGQVFFVHNRVADIDKVAERLRGWVPEARVDVAHGQLDATTLEDRLVSFISRDRDVLVCSAIIESGIDLPNVNTILVHHADRFGLAQLYQLRGRVGRGSVRGRCLLLTEEGISRDARRRLQVLVEHTDLGSGMQVALADLELRGAGNLLGEAQSGNIDAVGYDTWLELLAEAVSLAKGEIALQNLDPDVEVPVAAFLPENLLPEVPERLAWYRDFATARTPDAVDRLAESLEDQLGDLPEEARNLAGLHVVRAFCQELGVARCAWLRVRVRLQLHTQTRLERRHLEELIRLHPKRFELNERPGEPLGLDVRFLPQEADHPFHFLRWVFGQLRASAPR